MLNLGRVAKKLLCCSQIVLSETCNQGDVCALGEKQVKTKEMSDSLTPAADCNSCRMTRRPCLCSSHRSPEEGRKPRNRGRFKDRLVHES